MNAFHFTHHNTAQMRPIMNTLNFSIKINIYNYIPEINHAEWEGNKMPISKKHLFQDEWLNLFIWLSI